MKINLSPTYISDASSARRQPIPIDVNLDPTVNSLTAPFKQARQNGYISPIGLGKNASAYLIFSQSNFLSTDTTDGNTDKNPTPTPETGVPPLKVANLHAVWDSSAQNILVTFDFDLTDSNNQYFDYFAIQLHSASANDYFMITPKVAYNAYTLSTTSINQSVKISLDDAYTTGIFDIGDFDGLEVATFDTGLQTAGYVATTLDSPICDLDAPIISSANGVSTYTITTSNLSTQKAKQSFSIEAIEEFITTTKNASQATIDAEVAAALAAGNTGWVQVAEGSYSPITVYANDGMQRYVRAFFLAQNGLHSPYSNYVSATPSPLQPNNSLPPSGVTNASAAFGGTSKNDIVVTYTLPTIDPADPNALISLKVKLVPTDQPTQLGFFYHTVVSGETSFTIPSNLIFAQFGNYYSSYSGTVVGVSQYGTESTSVANIATFTRANPLSGVVPVASVSNVVDGYTVNFNFSGTAATNAEVYQFFVDPTPLKNLNIDIQDYFDATFSSGGTSGQNTLILNNWLGDTGTAYDIPNVYVGGIITGNGIPSNTYVQSLSGSGTSRTVTLSKNLTSQASGNYHIQNLVYKGTTAANIFLNLYQTVYLLVVFYDDYDNNSSPSINYLATPINPATSVIANAVQIGSGGAIYVGASKDSGSRIVLGPSGNKGPDGTSAYSGIFAFDYGSVAGDPTANPPVIGTPASTAIITNPSAGSYTFETTNAKIADWAINSTQIQNTLSGGATNYVGLSATGTYAFWAGSPSSGGSPLAKFTVTPQGAVVARNIQIIGSGSNSDILITAGGDNFKVFGDGSITATNATITGSLNVNQSSTFSSDITLVGNNAYLVAGSLSGSGVIVSKAGITANGPIVKSGITTYVPTTQITASPMGTTKDGGSITFSTNAAYLGSTSSAGSPWIVQNGLIYSGVISLDSANQQITINTTANNDTDPNKGVRLQWGTSGVAAIKVGDLTDDATTKKPNAQFYVTHGGALYATNATISGNVTANSFTIDDKNYWNDGGHTGDFRIGTTDGYLLYTKSTLKLQNSNILSGKTSASDTTNSGYFIGSDGSVIFGNSNTYISYSGSQIISTTTVASGIYTGSDGQSHNQAQTQTITLGTDGLHINGLSVYGDDSRISSIGATTDPVTKQTVTSYAPFTRVIQYAPQSQTNGNTQINGGDAVTGFAIYYGNHSPVSGGANTGFSGDLWVQI